MLKMLVNTSIFFILFFMKDIDLCGVWYYKESFPEGHSSGYLVIKKEKNGGLTGNLHGVENSLGEKPFYFVETFETSIKNNQLFFHGISVYGLFEDQEYFLDTWMIDHINNQFIIAESLDEQGASGAIVLTKI